MRWRIAVIDWMLSRALAMKRRRPLLPQSSAISLHAIPGNRASGIERRSSPHSFRRSVARVIRSLLAIAVLALTTTIVVGTFAAPRVRVVATPRLERRGAQTESALKVFGKLIDDAGSGVPGVQV